MKHKAWECSGDIPAQGKIKWVKTISAEVENDLPTKPDTEWNLYNSIINPLWDKCLKFTIFQRTWGIEGSYSLEEMDDAKQGFATPPYQFCHHVSYQLPQRSETKAIKIKK